MILIWPLVTTITLGLYFFILIALPFSSTIATVFLFALISFWSRLPGVGIPAPLGILYLADVIDLLSMIVAINIGGLYGAVFSLFCNIGGRMCGAFTHWGGSIADAIAMFFTCLVTPYVYVWAGGDLFLTMVWFMVIRFTLVIPIGMTGLYSKPLTIFIPQVIGSSFVLLLINSFYTKLFGDFFDDLLVSGLAFNWTLFFFATVVIVVCYLVMFKYAEKGDRATLRKNIKGFSKEIKKSLSRKVKKKQPEKVVEETKEKKKTRRIGPIKTIDSGCPVCKSDVKGNYRYGFYCNSCKKLYRQRTLKKKKEE